MRGRLIWPFLLRVHRLNAYGTETAGGYDDAFSEPKVDGGAPMRVEHPPILVPCQPENNVYDQLAMTGTGNDPITRKVFTFHFQDLERLELVDPVSGNALIRVGDRATKVYTAAGEFIQDLRGEDGLFCTEAQPASFGLSGGRRNLLVAVFEQRDKSYRGGG